MISRLLRFYFAATITSAVLLLYIWNSPSMLYDGLRYETNPLLGPAIVARLEQQLERGHIAKEGFRITVTKRLYEIRRRNVERFEMELLKRSEGDNISREELVVAACCAIQFKDLEKAKTLLDRAQSKKKIKTDIIDNAEGHDSYIDDIRKKNNIAPFIQNIQQTNEK